MRNGFGPNANATTNGQPSAAGGNLADQVVSSALRYRGQAPLVDMLMAEIGLNAGDLNGITQAVRQLSETKPADDENAADTPPVKTDD